MKRFLQASLMIVAALTLPHSLWASENALSIGYGFALYSQGHRIGRIAEGTYNFVQASYSYERPLSQKWLMEAGPFLSYVMNPADGVDVGVNLGVKVYPFSRDHSGFFLTVGTGGAYSSIAFREQGTHSLFILQGSIGYRYKNFFIEDRFRHYSNGGTAWPNQSINANIINVGMYF
jgi:hypothetical protein